MRTKKKPELRALWHPGTRDIFSGYGLVLRPAHLVGLLLIDRPHVADPAWLATLHSAFGDYQLTTMTTSGERGLVCQMLITQESIPYLRILPHPRLEALRDALLPLLDQLPAVTLTLAWYPKNRYWVSQIAFGTVLLFPLGQVGATPGALGALQNAGQEPEEFLDRHVRGDWGEVSAYEKEEYERGLADGSRVLFLSAYPLKTGQTIWVFTNVQRGETTVMLPHERLSSTWGG